MERLYKKYWDGHKKDAGVLRAFALVSLLLITGAGTAFAQNAETATPTAQQQKKRITGTVTDPDGRPLLGVAVSIHNTTIGTTTNAEGLFVIDARSNDDVLTFSYIGFLSQNVTVGTQVVINIALQTDVNQIEDVVVVGYGKQKRGSIASAVSTIGRTELKAPTSNLTNNLAGQLAGLIAVQRTGEPGRDDAEFWIRGISTYRGGSTPLILVDGIPREFSNIEPDEIESFTILKDAAATAVYGAEGANGVILVTTRRGAISKPKISLRAEYSLASPQRLPDFVDSWQFLELANEARFNDGQDPYKTAEEIELYRSGADPDLYPNSQWMKDLLRTTVPSQRYTINFTGGSENAKYFVSMAYLDQEGVFKKNPYSLYDSDFDFQRYNLRSNIDLKVSKTTQMAINLAGQYINRRVTRWEPEQIFRLMLIAPPHLFPPVYSDGTLSTYPLGTSFNDDNFTPYNALYNMGYKKEYETKVQADVNLTQDMSFLTSGLSLNGMVGLDNNASQRTSRTYSPNLYSATGRDAEGNLVLVKTRTKGSPELGDPVFDNDNAKPYRKIYIQGSINYAREFGRHSVGGMLLYMQKETQKADVVLPYRKQGLVGRATYSYDKRYSIEGNFGYTGSETFAKEHRFGFFPAVGVSYYVSNEKFYPETVKNVMNSAKLRISVGRTGNDATGSSRFLYRATFSTGGYNFNQGIGTTGGSNGLGAGYYDQLFDNTTIHWEIEEKRNIGVDLGFFGNSLELTADYFNNRRHDILIQRNTIPATAGFHAKPWENYGVVDNWGFDGSLNAHRKFGKFNISLRGTFSFARNKIVEYDELPQTYPWQQVTGLRIGLEGRPVYVAERLYTEDDFIRSVNDNGTYKYTLKPGLPAVLLNGIIGPGDIKYSDLNNDGYIDSNDKMYGAGHPYNPEVNYGFGFNVEYRGFYVSAFFQGTANTTIMLSDRDAQTNNPFMPFHWGIVKSNYRKDFLDRWTADNPRQDVVMPRLHTGYGNSINEENSTWWLKSGNFLRFKNLEVGYNFPKELAKKIKFDGARVYFQGYNICLWDNLKFWDPEMGNKNRGNTYPMSRTFTLGIELNF
ncbi:MAG: TonB-dependent receptor [Rikenellaceae bacterium]|jgi:TonB-linked SusC/RagA family outer membrane protein|nr:TonB-dependent receptor [Rikenellaceae bacterium]